MGVETALVTLLVEARFTHRQAVAFERFIDDAGRCGISSDVLASAWLNSVNEERRKVAYELDAAYKMIDRYDQQLARTDDDQLRMF